MQICRQTIVNGSAAKLRSYPLNPSSQKELTTAVGSILKNREHTQKILPSSREINSEGMKMAQYSTLTWIHC